MNAVGIGPLVFSSERFAAILGIGAFLFLAVLIAWRLGRRFESWAFWSVALAVVSARLGHVLEHLSTFAQDPLRALAFWQGGFSWPWAVIPLAAFAVWRLPRRHLPWAAAPLAAGLLAWAVTLQLTTSRERPTLPETQFQQMTGEAFALGDGFEGPLVVNLWATWCPPCRREMPMMAEVAAEEDGVTFIFANQGEEMAEIHRYLDAEELNLGLVLLDREQQLTAHYDALGLPVTLFIDAQGDLVRSHLGEISREVLLRNIAEMTSG